MRRYWLALFLVVVPSFTVLGWVGSRIYQEKPPIPRRVVTADGTELVDADAILRGQAVWRSMGGMEIGSIWGHGSYVAPDWTADWLHREALFVLDRWARSEYGASFADLSEESSSRLQGRLRTLFRENGYDPATEMLTLPTVRAEAFAHNLQYFERVFLQGE
ncbi:MAG TPA: nitric-oxide reductase large subunit, partial [Acidobacteriota bacterium]|nr:nitric-oxide reductase large subunit [Acidobacteriota bacterium]